MVGGESDSTASICCKKNGYARLSLPYFSKDTKSLWPSALAKISDFFYMMKMLKKTSKVSWRIHRVSKKLQQRGIVVTDGLTSFVTSFVK